MLFGYPPAATQNNWLHDCLIIAIKEMHSRVDGQKRNPPWPKILPDEHQEKLRSRTGLRDRLKKYNIALRQLSSKTERDAVLAAVTDQNRIAELLANTCNCAAITALPTAIHDAATSLFDYAFVLLTDLKVRDDHYKTIYEAVAAHVCPFCGTEYFDAPGAPREALDHYLAKSLYPFAAANLRNLVPMGHKCNSNYKLAVDLLYDSGGVRRVAFDPYSHRNISVVLDKSDPFNGSTPNTPKWQIEFDPDSVAVPTWDAVFSIRARYQRDHLDEGYSAWLGEFRNWARSADQRGDTDADLVRVLERFEQYCSDNGMRDKAFLKAAVFRMLRLRCEEGNGRLKLFLRDLLDQSTTSAP
jgi:YgiT-type zinc finger domain-containing protein